MGTSVSKRGQGVTQAPWNPTRFQQIPDALGDLVAYTGDGGTWVMRDNEPFEATAYFEGFAGRQHSKTSAQLSLYDTNGVWVGTATAVPMFFAEMVCDPAWSCGRIRARFVVGRVGVTYTLCLADDPMTRELTRIQAPTKETTP